MDVLVNVIFATLSPKFALMLVLPIITRTILLHVNCLNFHVRMVAKNSTISADAVAFRQSHVLKRALRRVMYRGTLRSVNKSVWIVRMAVSRLTTTVDAAVYSNLHR